MMFWGMSAEVIPDGAAATAVTDFSRFLAGQKLAWVKAVELGLSTCAPEQAEELPAPWVEALARAIFRISGIQSQGDSFR